MLTKTSEKTVEVNILRDLANCIEDGTGLQVTVISPSQQLERIYGFDDVIQILPEGYALALQFKGPENYASDPSYAKFTIDNEQFDILFNGFSRGQVFYAFSPFPTVNEFISIRSDLLCKSSAIDVRDIPCNSNASKTRTVKTLKSSADFSEISDPPGYSPLNTFFIKELCQDFQDLITDKNNSTSTGMKIVKNDNQRKKVFKVNEKDFPTYVSEKDIRPRLKGFFLLSASDKK